MSSFITISFLHVARTKFLFSKLYIFVYVRLYVERSALNSYGLPVPKNLLDRVDRTSSPIHVGKLRNAIDFIVPEFTPVLAAANGIVTYVKDNSTIGGPNPIYQKYTNFITIMHANEEFSRYDHFGAQRSK